MAGLSSQEAANRLVVVSPCTGWKVPQPAGNLSRFAGWLATLPARERQTLCALLFGKSEKQVAAKLGLSPNTIHIYVKNLYRKLGVTSRAELIAMFLLASCGGAEVLAALEGDPKSFALVQKEHLPMVPLRGTSSVGEIAPDQNANGAGARRRYNRRAHHRAGV